MSNVMIKQDSTVQLELTCNEYTYVMHAFNAFIDVLEERTGMNEKELRDIYNKMYMTRRIGDVWFNKGGQ